MNILNFRSNYLDSLSAWAGFKINLMEDFDTICQCELDFIEILLLGEKEFAVNMLENTKAPQDFSTVRDFLGWAGTNPVQQFS